MRKFLTTIAVACALSASYSEANAERAPTSLVIVACRAVERTEWPEISRPLPGVWYPKLYINDDLEYECKRELLKDMQDSTHFSPTATGKEFQLEPNWGEHGQCARAAMMTAPRWNDENRGWAVVAVGCPTPIWDDGGSPDYWADDRIIGWHLPGCPTYLPGTTNRMKCRFDESSV